MNSFRYYNHAILPTTAPHQQVHTEAINNNSIWNTKVGKKALFARWTSEYDCGYETNWWYCVKDTPFVIENMKAKRRYEVRKGRKNFDVKVIDAHQYKNELYEIQKEAVSTYPKKNQIVKSKEMFMKEIKKWKHYLIFGAFFKGGGSKEILCGYLVINQHKEYANLSVQKVIPEYEKFAVNAALIHFALEYYNEKLIQGYYLVDGERNIFHVTAFQDYLEKYFGFRKAYCKLNIAYRPSIRKIVFILYLFKDLLERLDSFPMIHQINAVLKMEQIRRAEMEVEK